MSTKFKIQAFCSQEKLPAETLELIY